MKQYAKNFLYIMAGNLMLTFGTVAFLEPTGIISGGTTGVGLFLLNIFHVPMAATFAVVNGLISVGAVRAGKALCAHHLAFQRAGPRFHTAFWPCRA
ncbi:MAG: YitT family protein [Oscillospiraceae bacterium]|nr:YitT family protein [Oscillospiraceae bacterium]